MLNAGHERTEFPFTITVGGVDTPLEVRTRGKSRLRVCDFPPLRLAYRLFYFLSEDSYRVRLLRVEYVDTGNAGTGPLLRDAFLIESDERFAARRGAARLRHPVSSCPGSTGGRRRSSTYSSTSSAIRTGPSSRRSRRAPAATMSTFSSGTAARCRCRTTSTWRGP